MGRCWIRCGNWGEEFTIADFRFAIDIALFDGRRTGWFRYARFSRPRGGSAILTMLWREHRAYMNSSKADLVLVHSGTNYGCLLIVPEICVAVSFCNT